MTAEPKLLRVPQRFETVEQVLACAAKMNLTNVLVLSQRDNGNIVFLDSPELTLAQANWLVDQAKAIILGPDKPQWLGGQ